MPSCLWPLVHVLYFGFELGIGLGLNYTYTNMNNTNFCAFSQNKILKTKDKSIFCLLPSLWKCKTLHPNLQIFVEALTVKKVDGRRIEILFIRLLLNQTFTREYNFSLYTRVRQNCKIHPR